MIHKVGELEAAPAVEVAVYSKLRPVPVLVTEKLPENEGIKEFVFTTKSVDKKDSTTVPLAICHVYELQLLNPVGFPTK